ncbi:Predicted amidohydrolase [Chitinophaga costaii]|uniref:Omega-amidase YafV n=1 Tax=Chitinophaga costaii TaxID=1335309 RepID=A0A1C4FQL1_9BACT|nr:amidohydrolase [Chitinophaga costaii]PUZ20437.1 amidohydrolase [Chitinophaga costaii]SCC57885.1 Predicted amidohydrolase [Chitinophaga costaii]
MADLTVTLIQANLNWENIDANLRLFDEKINAIQGRTEVVILPEMFSTGFSMRPEVLAQTMEGSAVIWMEQKAREKNVILTGSLIIKDGDHYVNRLLWMQPNGVYGIYDKRHLFGYAGEDNHYHAGDKRLIAQVKGWKINLNVCYDLRFPVWSRNAIQQDGVAYDVLINVANWPERRNTAWKALLQARAIENQAYVIGLNRVGNDGNNIYHSGDSSIIDPLGEILYQKAHDEDVFTYTLHREKLEEIRKNIPFLKDADKFQVL